MVKKKDTGSPFGHCAFGGPDLSKHDCPGKYQRWYFGPVKKGRKTGTGIIYLDEYRECNCLCHIPEADRPKPKRTRKKKQ